MSNVMPEEEDAGMTAEQRLQEADEKLRKSNVHVGQRWRHVKTNDVYTIVSMGVFEVDFTPMIGYRRGSGERVWYRYLSVFLGRTVVDGAATPRFVLVEDAPLA